MKLTYDLEKRIRKAMKSLPKLVAEEAANIAAAGSPKRISTESRGNRSASTTAPPAEPCWCTAERC